MHCFRSRTWLLSARIQICLEYRLCLLSAARFQSGRLGRPTVKARYAARHKLRELELLKTQTNSAGRALP